MVVHNGGGFRDLQNAMDLSRRGKYFENSSKLTATSDSVQESAAEGRDETVETLQSAFLKFKRNRQNKLQRLTLKKPKQNRSEEQIVQLREKFVEQARSYFGVPYARRYHEPGSPEFDSPLFLDCCGLVRKVLRDMNEDFGFSIGPWNQAYMFDTLPNTIEDTKDMKAGDLVFVSGTFYNSKKRKQKHNIVHVEIWAGDGEKTIGARWQKGKVQIHESYKYVSKSYYDMVYHFKSIHTWLNGTCKSFCSQHPWKSSSYVPGKKSIFSLPQGDEPADFYPGREESTKEMEEYDETDENTFEGNHFQTKVEDDEEVSVEVICDKGMSNSVGVELQEQKNCISTEEDYINFGTKPFVEKKVAINEATIKENKPQSEIKLSQNVISSVRNAGNVGRVTKEGNNTDHQDVFNCKLEASYLDKTSEEVIGLTQYVIGAENERDFDSMDFEYACFCERCVSVADVLTLEDEESKYCELFHCNPIITDRSEVLSTNDRFDILYENSCASQETRGEPYSDLEQGNESDDIQWDNTLKVNHYASRPNAGGAGAGSPQKRGLTTQTVKRRERGASRQRGNGDDDQTNNAKEPSKPFCRPSLSLTRLHQKTPTFFIGGHNGAKMVDATLSSFGWKRIHDKDDPTFYLKWVECKRNLDFASFREGEQLVNHIPNGNLLTTKIGLLTSLQEFDRVNSKVPSSNRRGLQMKDFVPETFKLQNQTEIDNFIHHIYQDGEMWICKPTGMNQGKGIFLIRNREELLEKLGPKVNSSGRQRCFPSPGKVVQRYILNPFLLNGHKADIRTYMLIAGTSPYMVFYHPGYVRLSLVPYSLTQEEVHAHLTNQYIQKKHPLYEQVKEETVWSLEQLQEYVSKTSNNTLPPDWVFTTFTKRMQEIMLHCFQSVRYKLDRKLGYFDLLGFDFMLDENLNVWLIEINVNPALHTNCKILAGIIPELVDSTLRLVLEVFEKSKKKERILPLENLGKFQLIFTDEKKS